MQKLKSFTEIMHNPSPIHIKKLALALETNTEVLLDKTKPKYIFKNCH